MNRKTLFCCLPALFCALLFPTSCTDGKKKETIIPVKKLPGKVLIVCYSQSDKQNTRTVAEWIREQTGGDLFAVTMKRPYSGNYFSVLKESARDRREKVLPEILPFTGNLASYDIVFIGSPVWFGTFAPPVKTFLKTYDLSGKTIIPFCTHGGGGAGKFYDDIAAAVPKGKVLPGLTVKGHNVVERMMGRGTKEKASPEEVRRVLDRIFP